MTSTITFANITAAAMGMQVAIGIILFVGAWTIWQREQAKPFWEKELHGLPLLILPLLLITLAMLFLSRDFAPFWRPLVGELAFDGIKSGSAILITIIADIVFIAVLIVITGGSERSVFVPLLVALPALAIFLREEPKHVTVYVVLVLLVFSAGFAVYDQGRQQASRFAYWLISMLCLLMTTGIGLATRPR